MYVEYHLTHLCFHRYGRDIKSHPEILPVTGIVIAAASMGLIFSVFSFMIVEADGDFCAVGTYFMATKLFNTPDVVINPAKPYHWQTYDVKREHSVEMMKQ